MNKGIETMVTQLMPLAYFAILIIVIVGMAQLIFKGRYKELPFFIVMCAIAIGFVSSPTTFKNLGEKIINIIMIFIDMFLIDMFLGGF